MKITFEVTSEEAKWLKSDLGLLSEMAHDGEYDEDGKRESLYARLHLLVWKQMKEEDA